MKERSSAVTLEEQGTPLVDTSNKEVVTDVFRKPIHQVKKNRTVKERIEELRADLEKQPAGLKSVFDHNNPATLKAAEGIKTHEERRAFNLAFKEIEEDAKRSKLPSVEKARAALHGAVTELGENRMLILDPNNEVVWRWMSTLKSKAEIKSFNESLKYLQKVAHEYRQNNPLAEKKVKGVKKASVSRKLLNSTELKKDTVGELPKGEVIPQKFAERLLNKKYSELQLLDATFENAKRELREAQENRPGVLERGYDALVSLFGQRRKADDLRTIELEQNIIRKKQALEQVREDIRLGNETYIALEILVRTTYLPAIETAKKDVLALEKKIASHRKKLLTKELPPENDIEYVRLSTELSVKKEILEKEKQKLFDLESGAVPSQRVASRY